MKARRAAKKRAVKKAIPRKAWVARRRGPASDLGERKTGHGEGIIDLFVSTYQSLG